MPESPPCSFRFAATLSRVAGTASAVNETCDPLIEQLGGPPDLVVAFLSHHHGDAFDAVSGLLQDRLQSRVLLGCCGESIVGGGCEIEVGPALSLWGARLPGVDLWPMHLEFARTPEGGSVVGWPDDLPDPWPAGSALLALGEPFTFPADRLLERINTDAPGVPVLGGMASGGMGPGENRLFLGRESHVGGAVAVLLAGPIRVRSVVSQGCRPIGAPYVVTKAEQNRILELGGRPPLALLKELVPTLGERDQALIRQGLHLGRVTNEYREQFRRGDFLIRNVIGGDPQSGAIAIGDYVRAGQTVQFHVRDEASADEDLRELLAALPEDGSTDGPPARGGLLFTCNGRGQRLFSAPHHDAGCVRERFPEIPLAGFFAQGEMGPVGAKNFLHGFTASVAIFEADSSGNPP